MTLLQAKTLGDDSAAVLQNGPGCISPVISVHAWWRKDAPSHRKAEDYWKLATAGFVKELPEPQSRYVSQMYEQAKVLEQVHGTLRDLVKRGRQQDAREFARENADKLARFHTVEHVKQAEAKINQRIRMIENGDLPADRKKALIAIANRQKDLIARRVATGA